MDCDSFADAEATLAECFGRCSVRVETERWQGVQANQATLELPDVNFRVDLLGIEDLDHWRKDCQPNLPWADDHFLERVGGEPLNPGEEWRKWPWSRSADTHRKDLAFNHTYMERMWPRYARRTEGGRLPQDPLPGALRRHPASDHRPKQGIAWPYGDLQDLVELLVAQPHTRQAWIPLFFPEDTGVADGGRKPCTLGYQVIMRDRRASIWYPLRSCDFTRHWRDDCYLAVRLLLWVVDRCRERSDVWKEVKPGMFGFHATSLHIFARDKLLERGPA